MSITSLPQLPLRKDQALIRQDFTTDKRGLRVPAGPGQVCLQKLLEQFNRPAFLREKANRPSPATLCHLARGNIEDTTLATVAAWHAVAAGWPHRR